ncbi:hypothetical protein KP509_31G039000 [Ceratopteris richardii]|uniref:Uncharacterized protein n=1 Tax=Ceratopteris richardii TaxID=49495 RepID=A0A8T2QX91_CERRI|nr:hypothetical protein KP509_31G039000 [Ceratopteris richardii]
MTFALHHHSSKSFVSSRSKLLPGQHQIKLFHFDSIAPWYYESNTPLCQPHDFQNSSPDHTSRNLLQKSVPSSKAIRVVCSLSVQRRDHLNFINGDHPSSLHLSTRSLTICHPTSNIMLRIHSIIWLLIVQTLQSAPSAFLSHLLSQILGL